jgi:hypothetical protein
MKKAITILGLGILMVSCNSNESKMKSGIKEYLEKNAKDPKSYEFVELKILDTVTIGELYKRKVENNELEMEVENDNIVFQNKLLNDFPSLPSDEGMASIKQSEEEIIKVTKQLELNKKNINNKEIVGYVATHKYRLKNGFGALDLSEMFVEFDKDFKFLEMNEKLNYNIFESQN